MNTAAHFFYGQYYHVYARTNNKELLLDLKLTGTTFSKE